MKGRVLCWIEKQEAVDRDVEADPAVDSSQLEELWKVKDDGSDDDSCDVVPGHSISEIGGWLNARTFAKTTDLDFCCKYVILVI